LCLSIGNGRQRTFDTNSASTWSTVPSAENFDGARNVGVTDAQFAELAAHIGMYTFLNFFNNLVKTKIDLPHVALEK
jgi:alkylhydroperoxidase family enzyme